MSKLPDCPIYSGGWGRCLSSCVDPVLRKGLLGVPTTGGFARSTQQDAKKAPNFRYTVDVSVYCGYEVFAQASIVGCMYMSCITACTTGRAGGTPDDPRFPIVHSGDFPNACPSHPPGSRFNQPSGVDTYHSTYSHDLHPEVFWDAGEAGSPDSEPRKTWFPLRGPAAGMLKIVRY